MKTIQEEKCYKAPEVSVVELFNEGMFCESFGENDKPEEWSISAKSCNIWNTNN